MGRAGADRPGHGRRAGRARDHRAPGRGLQALRPALAGEEVRRRGRGRAPARRDPPAGHAAAARVDRRAGGRADPPSAAGRGDALDRAGHGEGRARAASAPSWAKMVWCATWSTTSRPCWRRGGPKRGNDAAPDLSMHRHRPRATYMSGEPFLCTRSRPRGGSTTRVRPGPQSGASPPAANPAGSTPAGLVSGHGVAALVLDKLRGDCEAHERASHALPQVPVGERGQARPPAARHAVGEQAKDRRHDPGDRGVDVGGGGEGLRRAGAPSSASAARPHVAGRRADPTGKPRPRRPLPRTRPAARFVVLPNPAHAEPGRGGIGLL